MLNFSCNNPVRLIGQTVRIFAFFVHIFKWSPEKNNNYMKFPSLGVCDIPVQWWQIFIIGIIIFISGIDAFFWTPMFLGLLGPLFGLLAFEVGVIMIHVLHIRKTGSRSPVPDLFAGALSLSLL